MISELNRRRIAEYMLGENFMPCLYLLENGFLKSRELPIDTLAKDDDGYYLLNANLRVPLKAIVETHYSEDYGLVLQLEELDLTRRTLVR